MTTLAPKAKIVSDIVKDQLNSYAMGVKSEDYTALIDEIVEKVGAYLDEEVPPSGSHYVYITDLYAPLTYKKLVEGFLEFISYPYYLEDIMTGYPSSTECNYATLDDRCEIHDIYSSNALKDNYDVNYNKCLNCDMVFLPNKKTCNVCKSSLINKDDLPQYCINKLKHCSEKEGFKFIKQEGHHNELDRYLMDFT